MRGLHKAVLGLSALALAAGAIVGTQLVTQDRVGRAAVATPAAAAATAAPITPHAAVDTIVTTTTEAPPPPPPPPPTTTKPKPKPTTTAAKPKPKPAAAVGAPCSAAARACVDLSANRSWLLDGAGHVTYGPVPITSGRPGYRTPTGTFRVQWKDIDHLSTEFDNAPMPYSVFFVGGIAFHAGSLTVQSHGCIHLSTAAAQKYYYTLRIGDIVQVVP